MRHFILRLTIALLCCAIGICAVFYVHIKRKPKAELPSAPFTHFAEPAQPPQWLYIFTPTKLEPDYINEGTLVAFYSNGAWIRAQVGVEKIGEKLFLSFVGMKITEIGQWQLANQQITITINQCVCLVCAEFTEIRPENAVALPIAEQWLVTSGQIGERSSILLGNSEKYRLLLEEELSSAPNVTYNDIIENLSAAKKMRYQCMKDDWQSAFK